MPSINSKRNISNSSDLVDNILFFSKSDIDITSSILLSKTSKLNINLLSQYNDVILESGVSGPIILASITKFTNYFVSTWETNRTSSGSSNDNQIKLPLVPETTGSGRYNMMVYWGDGTSDHITEWDQPETTHTYSSPGTYTIYIKGLCKGWRFNNTGDRLKFMDVSNWGPLELSTDSAFWGCTNMNFTATDAPRITTPSFANMFRSSGNNPETSPFQQGVQVGNTWYFAFDSDINHWDVSSVTNMSNCFGRTFTRRGRFNKPLDNWDVSNVKNMSGMFLGQTFFNQNLDNWDTSSVTDMSVMFNECPPFNNGNTDPNVSIPLLWDVSSVTTFNEFLYGNQSVFNCDVSNWDVSRCRNFNRIFWQCNNFNSNIGNWDMRSAESAWQMTTNSNNFNNLGQPINWNSTLMNRLESTFENSPSLNVPVNIRLANMRIGNAFNNNQVFVIKKLSDDGIAVGGSNFNRYGAGAVGLNNNIGVGFAKLKSDGTFDNEFHSIGGGFGAGGVRTIEEQDDGKLLIGGGFSIYKNESSNRIIRLNTDGSRDSTFDIGDGFNNLVRTIKIQDDGKIIVGGQFTEYDGHSSSRLIRLNTDGSVDTTFDIGSGFGGDVYKVEIQSDGKILVGGIFNQFQGQSTNRLVRLNTDGSRDTTFDIGDGFNGTVDAIKIKGSDLYVGGGFTEYNNTSCSRIVKLNSNGSIDSTFTSLEFNNTVLSIDVQDDDKILVGGLFTLYDNETHNNIIRLNTDGSVDSSFRTRDGFERGTAVSSVHHIHIENSGDILVCGWFSTYDGFGLNRIARLYPDGYSATIRDNITTRRMFERATSFNNGGTDSIKNWTTTIVTNMQDMFSGTNFSNSCKFNQPIGDWDVGNVTNFSGMFRWNNSFDQNIGNWRFSTTSSIDMSLMFYNSTSFNNANSDDIKDWNTGSVNNMSQMFGGNNSTNSCKFNQPIDIWEVSSVENFSSMFLNNNAFSESIDSWQISSATNMSTMISDSFVGYDNILINWASQAPDINVNVTFGAGTSEYTSSAADYRDFLTNSIQDLSINDINDNGSGSIRIEVSSHGLSTGDFIAISGVSGTIEANGFWKVIVINTDEIDLVGSNFVNSYDSGGFVKTGYGWTITDGGQI